MSTLLDQVLEQTTVVQQVKAVADSLTKRIETIRELLPDHLKGQAERFVKRAALTMQGNPSLQRCTLPSIVNCVLKAAELGLAIDGRLAHAVPFRTRRKDEQGKDVWFDEAQMVVDYKGQLAVCRRSGLIKDAYARLVYKADEFDAWEEDDKCHLTHRPFYGDPNARGSVVGAYAKIMLGNGTWRYEWMTITEIGSIQARSKSKDRQGNPVGPWVTDWEEMCKKTVLHRGLKTYCDDPGVSRLMEVDAVDLDDAEPTEKPSLPTGRTSFNGNGRKASEPAQESPPPPETPAADQGDDAPPPQETVPGEQPEPEKQQSDQPPDREQMVDQLKAAIRSAKEPQDLADLKAEIHQVADVLGGDYVDLLVTEVDSKAKSFGTNGNGKRQKAGEKF